MENITPTEPPKPCPGCFNPMNLISAKDRERTYACPQCGKTQVIETIIVDMTNIFTSLKDAK